MMLLTIWQRNYRNDLVTRRNEREFWMQFWREKIPSKKRYIQWMGRQRGKEIINYIFWFRGLLHSIKAIDGKLAVESERNNRIRRKIRKSGYALTSLGARRRAANKSFRKLHGVVVFIAKLILFIAYCARWAPATRSSLTVTDICRIRTLDDNTNCYK